jgi:DNA-binding response OmpR family regulator
MEPEKFIAGKRILIVDDEKDVLEQLTELLEMCRIDTADSFEAAKKLLESEPYDVAVLDIMGVKGFELLSIANKHNIPALMLTAHGLSEENLKKSAEEGAFYYAPKDKMSEIVLFVADVLEAREENKSPWVKWAERLGSYYDRRFHGTGWREKEKAFWEEKMKNLPLV